MTRNKTRPVAWMQPRTIIILVVIVAALVGATWFAQYLKTQLQGPDVATLYGPLVRHITQDGRHCYDTGTDACEKYSQAKKEFTVGYLFRQPPQGLASRRLFGCLKGWRRTGTTSDFITTDPTECAQRNLSPAFLGYLSQEPEFEAPVKLVRCSNATHDSFLITDSPQECEATQHNEITTLGYAASAGFLPQHRLNELCKEATAANVLLSARQTYCQSDPAAFPKTECNDGLDNDANGKIDLADPGCENAQDNSELAPTPTPGTGGVSWHNKANQYDVNDDGKVSPIDLLQLINVQNRLGAHQLSLSRDGNPPPYIDINDDGHFSPIDVSMLSAYYRNR